MGLRKEFIVPNFKNNPPNYQDTLKRLQPAIERGIKALEEFLKERYNKENIREKEV